MSLDHSEQGKKNMKRSEIIPIIKRTTRQNMTRMEAFDAFIKAEPLINLDWSSFKRVWPMVHPKPAPKPAPKPKTIYLLSCNKCHGVGELWYYRHYRGGVCFDCKGKGKIRINKTTFDAYKNDERPHVRNLVSLA